MPELLLTVLGSRLGQIALALLIGFGWGWWRTDTAWRVHVATERAAIEAALEIERARQEVAAREISVEATRRLEEEQDAAAEMRRQIDDLKQSEARNAPDTNCSSCRVDGDFASRMRDLDATGPKARPSRRAR